MEIKVHLVVTLLVVMVVVMMAVCSAELRRWFCDVANHMANPPEYASPELFKALVRDKMRDQIWIQKHINPYKNDVFCMGMCLYYLLTMQEPKVSLNLIIMKQRHQKSRHTMIVVVVPNSSRD